jgi:hypothetical protein
MRSWIVAVLMLATAVCLPTISHLAPLLKVPAQSFAERNFSNADQDAQMAELQQRANVAMVRLQSRQQKPDQVPRQR